MDGFMDTSFNDSEFAPHMESDLMIQGSYGMSFPDNFQLPSNNSIVRSVSPLPSSFPSSEGSSSSFEHVVVSAEPSISDGINSPFMHEDPDQERETPTGDLSHSLHITPFNGVSLLEMDGKVIPSSSPLSLSNTSNHPASPSSQHNNNNHNTMSSHATVAKAVPASQADLSSLPSPVVARRLSAAEVGARPIAQAVIAAPSSPITATRADVPMTARSVDSMVPSDSRPPLSSSSSLSSTTSGSRPGSRRGSLSGSVSFSPSQLQALSDISNSQIQDLWKARTGSVVKIPEIDTKGTEVHIGQLMFGVLKHGGITHVRNHKKWNVVAMEGGLPLTKEFMNKLKRFYAKHVSPLERDGGLVRLLDGTDNGMRGDSKPLPPKHTSKTQWAKSYSTTPLSVSTGMDVCGSSPSSPLSSGSKTPVKASVVSVDLSLAVQAQTVGFDASSVKASPVSSPSPKRKSPHMSPKTPLLFSDGSSVPLPSSGASLSPAAPPPSDGTPVWKKNAQKRLKRWKTNVSQKQKLKLEQNLSQRMLLLERENKNERERVYRVLAGDQITYTVRIGEVHDCQCMAFAKGQVCSHVLFVLHRVLQVGKTNPILFQNSLSLDDLSQVFASAPSDPASRIKDEEEGRRDFFQNFNDSADHSLSLSHKPPSSPVIRATTAGKQCYICYEDFGSEPLTYCRANCGSNFHTACLKSYTTHVSASCPLCSSEWKNQDDVISHFNHMHVSDPINDLSLSLSHHPSLSLSSSSNHPLSLSHPSSSSRGGGPHSQPTMFTFGLEAKEPFDPFKSSSSYYSPDESYMNDIQFDDIPASVFF